MQPKKPKVEIEYVSQAQLKEALEKQRKEILLETQQRTDTTVSGLAARLIKNLPEMLTSAIVEVAPWIKPSTATVRGAMRQEFQDLMPRRQPNQSL